MALLEIGGRRITLPQGDAILGSDAACAIHVAVAGVLPKHARFKGLADGQVVISKAVPEADVLINGVRLGAEPTPLLHGDKVEVSGQELTFVDERRSGSTQYIQAMSLPEAAAQAEAKGGKATGNTGGRVVSLTDGREYAIAGASLVFGRDATCDVVVSGKDVSRRHAEIVQTPKGYLLVDSSTNGTWVNEVRLEGQRLLARTDVIKIGEESFRFYADAPSTSPSPPPPPPAAPNPQPGPAASTPPAAPQSPPKASLGSFLVRSGALKGQRLSVRTPIVNIGRADYNDLVLPDESISTAHAKLQRREGVWVLVDLDSTNGTYVDGERIKGEAALGPGVTVRFGEVSLVFEPTDDAVGVAKGGGTRMLEAMKAPPPSPRPAPSTAPAKPKAPPPPPAKPQPKRPVAEQKKKGKGCGAGAVLMFGVIAVVYWAFI